MLHPHHQEALERFVEAFSQKPEVQAILVGGSLVKGFGKPGSDLDVMVLLDPASHQQRQQSGELTYYSEEFTRYEGGYVDGKFISMDFLQQVADKGSEPARAAFWRAFVAWTREDAAPLEQVLQRITTYPEAQRTSNIQRFVAQVEAMRWYVGEAEKHDNPYLLNWSAVRAVLFTARILLAHNRLFFPYHKWMLRMLELAPSLPEGYLARAETLMRHPTAEDTRGLCDLVLQFQDWGVPALHWPAQFMQDSELNWLHGQPPIEDL